MKIVKAFTLVEVLVASLIFVLVITTAASSLVMLKRSIQTSDNLSLATGCTRELEDFVSAHVQMGVFDQRILPITTKSNHFKVDQVSKNQTVSAIGIVILKSKNNADIIYKNDSGNYLFSSYENFDSKKLEDDLNTKTNLNFAKIQSDACSSFVDTKDENLKDFNIDFNNPFTIISRDSIKKGDFFYQVSMEDIFFSHKESQKSSISNKTYSRVFVDLINTGRGI